MRFSQSHPLRSEDNTDVFGRCPHKSRPTNSWFGGTVCPEKQIPYDTPDGEKCCCPVKAWNLDRKKIQNKIIRAAWKQYEKDHSEQDFWETTEGVQDLGGNPVDARSYLEDVLVSCDRNKRAKWADEQKRREQFRKLQGKHRRRIGKRA